MNTSFRKVWRSCHDKCASFRSPFRLLVTNMAEVSVLKGETGRNTRGLLKLIILLVIAAAAISSRLFSVIRFESIIHECQSTTALSIALY